MSVLGAAIAFLLALRFARCRTCEHGDDCAAN